jgi:uncharacterized membrane protein required for colicin V production
MVMDILIFVPMLVFILLGFRDGVIRKLVAIVMLIAGLFLGQLFMHDLGQFLADNKWIESTDSSMYGYLIIFSAVVILQWLLYKLVARSYKIGGFLDRIGGLALGFIEGTLFLSCLFFIFAQTGFPSRDLKRDSMFYKPIVNIAPQILDLTSLVDSESYEKLKEMGKGTAIKGHGQATGLKSVDSAAVMDAEKQNEQLNRMRESNRKKNP